MRMFLLLLQVMASALFSQAFQYPPAASRKSLSLSPLVSTATTLSASLVFDCSEKIRSSSSLDDYDDIESFLKSDECMRTLFEDSESVEKIGDEWVAKQPSTSMFPGLTLLTENTFKTTVSGNSLRVELTSSKPIADGPRVLVAIFEAATAKPPKTSSTNVISVAEEDGQRYLVSDISLKLEMQVPRILPIPRETLARRGSKSMSAMIAKDVAPKLDLLTAAANGHQQ